MEELSRGFYRFGPSGYDQCVVSVLFWVISERQALMPASEIATIFEI